MIRPDANDIIAKSSKKLGDLGLTRMRNYKNGYGKSASQKNNYLRARIIQLNLGSLLDHLELDDDSKIVRTLRISDEQVNRFLNTLQVFAETNKYPVTPLLFNKVKPFIINEGKDGTNAPLPQFQYSSDASSWHPVFIYGDIYLRVSVDGSITWSPAILFIDTATFVRKTGDTMSGALNMGSNKITSLANGTASGDAVNKGQLDSVQSAANSYTDTKSAAAETNAKSYADGLVIGLWDDRGNFDASVNAYPSSGGSGTAGAIKKGDIWTISVAGTLPTGQAVEIGDTVRALIDSPGNTQGNWAIGQNNIGYVPENQTNKDTDGTLASNSDTKYPSQKAVKTYTDTKASKTQTAWTNISLIYPYAVENRPFQYRIDTLGKVHLRGEVWTNGTALSPGSSGIADIPAPIIPIQGASFGIEYFDGTSRLSNSLNVDLSINRFVLANTYGNPASAVSFDGVSYWLD